MNHATGNRAGLESQEGFWVGTALPLFLTGLLLFGGLGLSVFYTLPSTVVSLAKNSGPRPIFGLLAPQNFAYFTKNPQDNTLFAYQVSKDGSLHDLTAGPQNRASNLFGLSRTQRAQGPEIANLANNSTLIWDSCDEAEDPRICLKRDTNRVGQKIANTSPVSTICGQVVVAVEVPVEWTFRHLIPEDFRVVKSTRLNVLCPT